MSPRVRISAVMLHSQNPDAFICNSPVIHGVRELLGQTETNVILVDGEPRRVLRDACDNSLDLAEKLGT